MPDLLGSGSTDPHFVVETDDDGRAHLRFGNGDLGRRPAAGTTFAATYRVGNGAAGRLGADTITTIVFREAAGQAGNVKPRNPLPTGGGIDPEPVEEVRAFAPQAFRTELARAIVADDYAALAADDARRLAERPACGGAFQRLQGAKATLRWTGAWYQVFAAIDPAGTEDTSPELVADIEAHLARYRRIGHDVAVKPARYVGLDVALRVCVRPDYLRGHVTAALLDVLGNRILPDGTRGLFHPDNLTFGEGIYASRLVAAAQAVTGVQSVELTRLARFDVDAPPPGGFGHSAFGFGVPVPAVLPLGPFEIARLDDDRDAPENGRLTLDVGGGR